MNQPRHRYSCLTPIILLAAIPAEAYVGPGLGAGTLGVVLGILGSLLIAIFAFFWYPIKRAFKKWSTVTDDAIEDEDHLEVAKQKE